MKLSRQDREAREFAKGQDVAKFGIGTMEHHFGFQLTDFGKPGTEYVRPVVFSNGWIVGYPILGRDVFERATAAKRLRQRAGPPKFLERIFGKREDELLEFLHFLHGEIRERFTAQKKLAENFEADFSQAIDAISGYLENPAPIDREGISRVAETFSKSPINRPEVG